MSIYVVDGPDKSIAYLTMEEALANSAPEDGITELLLLEEPVDALISMINTGAFGAMKRVIRETQW